MSRSRKKLYGPPPNPYEAAIKSIDKLEQSVVKHTVPVEFDLEDVAAWLWPEETIKILKAAFPLVDSQTYTRRHNCSVSISNGAIYMTVDFDGIKMYSPRDKSGRPVGMEQDRKIRKTTDAIATVVRQFHKVKQVI